MLMRAATLCDAWNEMDRLRDRFHVISLYGEVAFCFKEVIIHI